MAKKSATKPTQYDIHPSMSRLVKWVDGLKEKTGRSVDEWVKTVRKTNPADERAARDWLKSAGKFDVYDAAWLARRAMAPDGEPGEETPEGYRRLANEYVAQMFSGPKTALRPIYDEILASVRKLGDDIRVSPCQTMVPIFRNYAIAHVKPTTRARVDLGLALGPLLKAKKKLPARLIDTGGFAKKDRITHRIELGSVDELDAEARKWLQTAYELDA